MFSKVTMLIPIVLLATACAQEATTPKTEYVYTDSSCTAFQPIITHGNDPDVMDARTVRAINAHNETWGRLCGEKANVQSN